MLAALVCPAFVSKGRRAGGRLRRALDFCYWPILVSVPASSFWMLLTHDFAKNVKALIQNEYWGLYNMVCGGQTSRLEVAGELLVQLGLNETVKITSVKSDYFKEIYFAERPPCERLVNRKLELRNLNLMQDWKVALKQYIDQYYQGYLD